MADEIDLSSNDTTSTQPVTGSYRDQLDKITRQNGYGPISKAVGNVFYGFNRNTVGNAAVPSNKDGYGLTFFTRPRMNLSYDNLQEQRRLTPLLTDLSYALPRAIRVMLDPVGATNRDVQSDLIDNQQAFMPMLSNLLLGVSGWPDITVDTYTSTEGVAKEAWSMVDGMSDYYGTFDITANFKNMAGDPITLLFNVWTTYMSAVYRNEMVPYPEAIVENEIDYQTRIYRLVLDQSRRFVTKIAACGASFPIANPLGAAFNYTADSPFIKDNDQISIPFRCMGAMYMDPILFQEFNDTVVMFNSGMSDATRETRYQKLLPSELVAFNNQGYPRIDPITQELEWWVDANQYVNDTK